MKARFFFIFAVLVTAVLCFGGVANAQSTDISTQIAQLQAQVQALLQQIVALQAQQDAGTTTAPTTAWCYTFNKNMGYGAKGADYDALIKVLELEGITKFISANKPGQYDKNVGDAVIKLQAKYKISKTGYFGSQTRAKINAIYKCQSASATILTSPSVTSKTPYIIGTATGVTQVGIVLSAQSGDGVYKSGLIPVTNGNWSVTVTPALALGHYVIYVYDANNNLLQKGPLNIVPPEEDSFRNVSYVCYDGTAFNEGGSSSCKESSLWESYAEKACQGKCSATTGKCGVNTFAVSNPCSDSCTPNWQCATWSTCVNGQQTRTCTDTNNCGTTTNKPTPTQSCTATQPSITVTSPNGGEIWTQGSTHEITWTSTGLPSTARASIALVKNNMAYSFISPLASTGHYTWTIPATLTSGASTLGSQMKIKIIAFYTDSVTQKLVAHTDTSDNYFAIVAATEPGCSKCADIDGDGYIKTADSLLVIAQFGKCVGDSGYDSKLDVNASGCITTVDAQCITDRLNTTATCNTQPSITVTSPNGGETWAQGSTHNITWASTGISSGTVQLSITNYDKNTSWAFIDVPVLNGSYSWTIPTIMNNNADISTIGESKITVLYRPSSGLPVKDSSDNYFTIAAAPPAATLNISQSSLASISDALNAIAQQIQALLGQ